MKNSHRSDRKRREPTSEILITPRVPKPVCRGRKIAANSPERKRQARTRERSRQLRESSGEPILSRNRREARFQHRGRGHGAKSRGRSRRQRRAQQPGLQDDNAIPNATRLLKVFSAADSQHRFMPNRALRPGSIREAQCSVEAFFCHSFALLHSFALRSIDKSGEGEALSQVVHGIFDSRLCLLLLVSRLL